MKRTPWPDLEGENEENERIGKGEGKKVQGPERGKVHILYLTPLPKIPACMHCVQYYTTSLIKPEPEPEMESGWGAAAFSAKRSVSFRAGACE